MDLLRIEGASAKSGLKRATLYRDMKVGLFPSPIKIGTASAWPSTELEAVNAARVAGKSDAEIRTLISDLQRQRTAIAE